MLVKLCKYSAHKNSILLGVGHWPVNGLCMCVAHTNSSSTCQKQKKAYKHGTEICVTDLLGVCDV